MLIAFGVKNYKSIKEEQEFSFLASSSINEHPDNYVELDNQEKVLKTTLVYGRNASGKSNLLEALSDFLKMVKDSTDLKLNQSIPAYKPFLFDKESKKENSKFWIEIIADDNIKYYYEVIFNKDSIVEENLDFYPKGYPANLFSRKNDEFKYGDYLKGEKRSIENQLLKNQLFLSKGVINNHEQLKVPFLKLQSSMSAVSLKSSLDDRLMSIFMHIANDKEADSLFSIIHNINELLKVADTGITKIETEELDEAEIESKKSRLGDSVDQLKKELRDSIYKFNIKSFHKVFNDSKEIGFQEIPFGDESEGSKRLAVLGTFAVFSLASGSLLIIDELNNSLHPLLTTFFVKLFHSKKYNPNNAQLLFSTHDTSLLNSELVRRDQVWFAEKNKFGESSYYSIADFKGIRSDIPIEKWYLSGRFGAIPVLSDIDLDLKI